MHTIDNTSLRIILKVGIPVLFIAGCWVYGFIKGLLETNTTEDSNPEKDVKYYSKKIKSEPNDYKNYFERGTASFKLYDYENALNDLNRAIELNNKYSDAYANRGAVYYALGQIQNAMNDYNIALELNPNSAILFYNRGVMHYELNDINSAIADLKTAINLRPEDKGYLSFYGQLQYELENKS